MRRFFRYALLFFVVVLLLLVGGALYLSTPSGKAFLSRQVSRFASEYLQTEIKGNIDYRIPDWVVLSDYVIYDQQKDTLLAGKTLRLDLDMLALIQKQVKINKAEIENTRLKLYRIGETDRFNHEFMLEAFSDTTAKDTTKAALQIDLSDLTARKLLVTYDDPKFKNSAAVGFDKLKTGLNKLDIDQSIYSLKDIDVDGLAVSANFAQLKTDTSKVVKTKPAEPSKPLQLVFQQVNFTNARWDIRLADFALHTTAQVNRLQGAIERVDLDSTIFRFPTLQLEAPLLTYTDTKARRQPRGLDYGHLKATNIFLTIKDLFYSPKQTTLTVQSGKLQEQSGLNIQQLGGNFLYDGAKIAGTNFILRTPTTYLSDRFTYVFPPASAKASNIGLATVDIRLRRSYLGAKDVLLFVPDLAKNEYFKKTFADRFQVEGEVKGRVNNLTIQSLAFEGLNGSRFRGSGVVRGLPDTDRLALDLNVQELTTTRKMLSSFLPPDVFKNYGIPERLTLQGKLNGTMADLRTNLTLNSTIGNAALAGQFRNITGKRPEYDGTLQMRNFDLQYLLKNDDFRKASFTAKFTGSGFDPKTLSASLRGTLNSAYYKGYTYQNMVVDGSLRNQLGTFTMVSADPNAEGRLEGTVNLAAAYPVVQVSGNFGYVDFQKLNLYNGPLRFSGGISVNMSSTDPANPLGTITLNNSFLDWGQGRKELGDLKLIFDQLEGQKSLIAKGDFVDMKLNGQFTYDALANVLLTEVNKYFKLPAIAYTPVTTPTRFTLAGTLIYQPFLRAFLPAVNEFKPIKMEADFDNTRSESLVAKVDAPYVMYDSMAVRQASLDLRTQGTRADYAATLGQLNVGGFQLQRATMTGDVQNNIAAFQFVVKDSLNAPLHSLAGNVTTVGEAYRVNLSDDNALLAKNPWTARGGIEWHTAGLLADNLRFTFLNQELRANSKTPEPNAPIQLTANQIVLKELATAFLRDSTLVSGLLDADMEVRNLMESPTFTGNFKVSDLAVTQIPVGLLEMKAANEGTTAISVDGTLSSEGNDVRLSGNYLLNNENSPLDFLLDVQRIDARTIQAFSFGNLQRAEGNLRGLLTIKGKPTQPKLRGDVFFDKFNFTVKQLGSRYLIADQQLVVTEKIVEFNDFVLSDSLGQKMTTNGVVNYTTLTAPSYRLSVTSQNFMVVDAAQGANDYFFGKGIVDSDLLISGVSSRYQIEGDVIVKPGSKLTLLMPKDDGALTEMQQVVQFVDRDAPLEVEYERVLPQQPSAIVANSSQLSINIQADEQSELSLLLDELSGDNLRVRGNGRLRAGINASGELFMYGDYRITEGSYDLTVQLLRREFQILKGADNYIRWTGELMKAQMNITAAYTTRTPLQKYVEGQNRAGSAISNAGLRQNVPVTVLLRLENTLEEIKPTFEIGVNQSSMPTIGVSSQEDLTANWISVINPDGTINSPSRAILRENESYINQNAFFLITFNRFFDGNINDLFTGGGGAEQLARQSVSALLSDQLENFASSLIKGVDLDVGLNSDFATRSTSLNLGVSKAFFNDRISISVGRNFELENAQRQSTELFDNIEANYKITKDGRYRLRGYRKNQYQTVLEGFVVETGVGFVITLDFNRLFRIMQRLR